ncbi:MAG: FAD-dependent oxidoreductase, partial [Gammaproteobacteria bacterium]
LQNMMSGVLPVPDMFIYGYALIDLLSQPFNRDHYRDQYSVNGFMASRGYATDRAAREFQRSLAKAFACPPYRTSAVSYKTFLKYGFRHPEPMMWVLEGDCYNHFLKHLVARLADLGCTVKLACEVKAIELDDKGVASGLQYQQVPGSDLPDEADPEPPGAGPAMEHAFDYLILAVPPDRLGEFVGPRLYEAAPELGEVRQLHGEPIASLDLYFNKKIGPIPSDHVVLTDSEYELSFIDNSQLWKEWPNAPHTYLNLVASDFDVLAPMAEVDPEYAKRKIIDDLLRAMPVFTYEDIDLEASFLNTNVGEHIFINEVGSWSHRPQARTRIPNLFLAGDYCRSCIDITTIEGAVITGLTAAEALRSDAEQGSGRPIEITEPAYYPEAALAAMKLLWKPYAYAAKAWSMAGDTAYGRFARQFVEGAMSRLS